jgi:hypothetical protein
MPSIRRLVLAAALLAVALPAAAADRYPDRSPWIIGLDIGLARYAMDDINAAVDEFNANPDVDDINRIDNGPEFSVSVARRLTPSLTAGLKFTRLDAATDLPSPTGAFEINAGANVWGGFVQWVPPREGGMSYGLGVDAGIASTTGEINLAIPLVGEYTGDFKGSAPAAAAYAIVDFVGTRTVSFQGHVGYRIANIEDVELDGVPSGDDIDSSGIFLRAAFRIHP